MATIERSLGKPAKRGFASMIGNSLIEVPVRTNGGIYLGHADALQLDEERICRVMSRIIKGLYYEENRKCLPSTYEAEGCICVDDYPDSILRLLDEINYAGFSPVRTVQAGVFEYTYQATREDCDSTFWLGSFYERLSFFGYTRRQPRKSEPDD
jgi:hypothetical protein